VSERGRRAEKEAVCEGLPLLLLLLLLLHLVIHVFIHGIYGC
jgi:hypothetical protein